MLHYNGTTIGEIIIKQGENKYKIQIRQGNCLAVFLHVCKNKESTGRHDKYIHMLYCFWADTQHVKNIKKNYGHLFSDEIVSIRINMYYKENYKLLKFFVEDGNKVDCCYKKPKNTKDHKL